MKMIYMASPYQGDTESNVAFAKTACQHVIEQGHGVFAPHLLYPEFLDDSVLEQRELALQMGFSMIERCDEVWVYGDRISHGMMQEIDHAREVSIPIRRVQEMEGAFVIGAVMPNATSQQAPQLAESQQM